LAHQAQKSTRLQLPALLVGSLQASLELEAYQATDRAMQALSGETRQRKEADTKRE